MNEEKINEALIYTKALNKWGLESQIKICVEECAELIVKLMKWGRNINGSDTSQIREEIADVDICISQMKLIFREELIIEIRKARLIKLKDMLGD